MSIERLQKILAQAGIASRRKAEELIEDGSVTVNGKVAKLGDKADFQVDHIKVNGTLIRQLEDHFYVVMNKPKGVISMMSDPEGRPTLADYLAKMKAHLNPIGRLDFNSEGLLLLTNDGALAEKIQKSDAFPRVYHVKVRGHITTEMIERLSRGARLAKKFAKPLSVRIHEELNKKTKIEIVFVNAANVDVKTYFEEKGFLVEKIVRTGIGHLTLHGLEPGKYRVVPKSKFEALVEQPELGTKAIEFRHEKEKAILPRDQRLRNVDEFGRVIPKAGADEERAPTRGSRKEADAAPAGRSHSGVKADRIVVRATGDGAPAPGAKRRPEAGGEADLPKFKRRTGPTGGDGAPRIGSRRGDRGFGGERSGPKPRMSRFGDSPRGGDDRPRGPRFGGDRPRSRGFGGRDDARGERPARSSEGGRSFGAPRGPRVRAAEGGGFGRKPEGRGGFGGKPAGRGGFGRKPEGRGGFGGKPAGRSGFSRSGGGPRPIARVKRKEK